MTMGKPTTSRKVPSPASSPVSATGASPKRRPIRPIDRQKMRPWLQSLLNSGTLGDVLWWKVQGRSFAVKWPHAARQGFKVDDARLFRAWAEHSGIYREGDEEADHKKWKSNFRCALHSVPDIQEVTSKEERKGQNATRVYVMLDEPKEKRNKKNKLGRIQNKFVLKEEEEENDPESESDVKKQETASSTPPPILNLPNFSSLGVKTTGLTFVRPNHLSGGMMKELKQEPTSPPPPLYFPSQTVSPLPYPVPSNLCSETVKKLLRDLDNDLVEDVKEETPENISLFQNLQAVSDSKSKDRSSSVLRCLDKSMPKNELELDLGEDMRAVAIMTRVRTPSGDSGLPSSSSESEEDGSEEGNLEKAVLDFAMSESMNIDEETDKGIFLWSVADDCPGEIEWTDELKLLDISTNAPPAVTTETLPVIEDFRCTSLEAMDTA